MTSESLTESEITLPVKQTDGETLEDRLTSNAYQNILPARYLRRNADGDLIETQEDLFERVAKNIALAEAVYEADKQGKTLTVTPDQIKPDHPRRDELAEEVFGLGVSADDTAETPLTEQNVSKFAYDTIVPNLPSDVKAVVEQKKSEFQDLMERLGFIPNSPTLMNAGDELQQLSACFVDSPEDDIKDIHETMTEAAEVFQSGGGMGYSFSRLRPYGDTVGSTGGIASGPITFMRTYDQMCETIAQGGARRGAQMGIMRVSHPDIIQFIHAKNKDVSLAHSLRLNDPDDYTHTQFIDALKEARDLIDVDEDGNQRVPKHLRNAVEGHLSNFNISVAVTDAFMDALQSGSDFTFTNPRTGDPHIATAETKELYDQFELGEYVTVGEPLTIPAEELWADLIEGAHENGEPGVIYIDRANAEHSFPVESTAGGTSSEYEILATNPCVAEGSLVNTPSGYTPVEEISEGDEISTVIGSEPVDEVEVHENHDVHEVVFSDGSTMEVTAQHRFHVLDGKEVVEKPLSEVEVGEHVRRHPAPLADAGTDADYTRYLKKGVLLGDGSYTPVQIEQHNRIQISISTDDSDYNNNLKSLFGNDQFNMDYTGYDNDKSMSLQLSNGADLVDELNLTPAPSPEKSFDVTDLTTQNEVIGLLDGLLATDGNVNLWATQPQIRWDTSSDDLAQGIKKSLVLLGLNATLSEVTDSQRGGSINGRKVSANYPKYTVTLSGDSAGRYAELSRVSDLHPEKGEKLFELRRDYMTTGDLWKAEIREINPVSDPTTVYDLYCSGSDTWITEGYVQQGCGEQPLMEYEACNLGHINLSTLVDTDAPDWRVWSDQNDSYDTLADQVDAFLDTALDYDDLDNRIRTSTRFLENVVTMSDFPVDEITETVANNRKIGLGIMGLAQLYIQLGIQYGTDPGDEVARQVMRHINHGSKTVSHELAEDRGPFGNWEDSKYANPTEYREWFEKQTGESADDWEDGYPIRNHNTTTIAPTGTTSMIGNTSGGCEPIYNVAYYKNVSDDVQGDEMLVEFDDYFLRTLEANDLDVDAVKAEAEEQMAANEFDGIDSLSTVPDSIAELFVVTGDLSGIQHAAVQTACQEGVDSSISKTCNFPNDATPDDMDDVFRYIYENGGKGVTVYRDGTRSKQVLTTRADNTEFANEAEAADALIDQIETVFGGIDGFLANDDVQTVLDSEIESILSDVDAGPNGRSGHQTRPRPNVLFGSTQAIETGYGTLYVNINNGPDGDQPFEVFGNIGHSGGFTNSFTEALSETISAALRAGVAADELQGQLEGIRSPKVAWDRGDQINSIPDAFGVALRRHMDGDIYTEYSESDESERTLNLPTTGETDASDSSSVDDSPRPPESDTGSAADSDAVLDAIQKGDSPECPDCGSMSLYYSEGCKTCEACGWSEC